MKIKYSKLYIAIICLAFFSKTTIFSAEIAPAEISNVTSSYDTVKNLFSTYSSHLFTLVAAHKAISIAIPTTITLFAGARFAWNHYWDLRDTRGQLSSLKVDIDGLKQRVTGLQGSLDTINNTHFPSLRRELGQEAYSIRAQIYSNHLMVVDALKKSRIRLAESVCFT